MIIKLKELLEVRDMSVYKLSKATGISEHNLANLIKGKTNSIRFDTIKKICEVLNVDLTDIMELDN